MLELYDDSSKNKIETFNGSLNLYFYSGMIRT